MDIELSHEELEELISADALGGLDEEDAQLLRRELERHGPECEECRSLIATYAEVAGRMALELDPVSMSPGAEERLLMAARESTGRPSEPEQAPAEQAAPPGGPGQERRPEARVRRLPGRSGQEGRPRRWLVAAAVAASLVLAGFVGYRIAPSGPTPLRVAAFPAKGSQSLAVVYQPGEVQGLLVGSNLAPPPAGKVYELWFQPAKGAAMHPAGTFVPANGSVLHPVTLGTSFDLLAVSVEPTGGSPQPTTNPIFLTPV